MKFDDARERCRAGGWERGGWPVRVRGGDRGSGSRSVFGRRGRFRLRLVRNPAVGEVQSAVSEEPRWWGAPFFAPMDIILLRGGAGRFQIRLNSSIDVATRFATIQAVSSLRRVSNRESRRSELDPDLRRSSHRIRSEPTVPAASGNCLSRRHDVRDVWELARQRSRP